MKSFSEYIKEAYNFRLGGSKQRGFKKPIDYKYYPKNLEELQDAIRELLGEEKYYVVHGEKTDLNCIDTSEVTDMTDLFFMTNFGCEIDISQWDTGKVETMEGVFYGTDFNGDISEWDVSSVTNMENMFRESYSFNQDISHWDVSNVTNMTSMFRDAESFNQDISKWKVVNVKHNYIFDDCPIKEEYKPNFIVTSEYFDVDKQFKSNFSKPMPRKQKYRR